MSKIFDPEKIFVNYERYKENALRNKWVKYSDILPLLEKISQSKIFSLQEVAHSVENRSINLIEAGSGNIPVLLWSQMHGDESTATMALFDVFNFLMQIDDQDNVRDKILSKLNLFFIPMLNPDGAEKFTRRNALNIDLNRDAVSLQSPESKLLKELRDKTSAEFGFNLHDQSPYYSAGINYKSAAISFLAPPLNFEKCISTARKRSMQLIAYLNDVLGKFIPGHIAKYSDDFEPRAFGDNIQKWGTSTILIESGGWQNDLDRQFVRKLNFTAIISALYSIAVKSYKKYDTTKYFNIPDNEEILFDLIIRNANLKIKDNLYKIDIGIKREEIAAPNNKIYYKSVIEDLGDLSTFHAYEELNCEDMEIFEGKTKFLESDFPVDLTPKVIKEFLLQGITTLQVKKKDDLPDFLDLPVNFTFQQNFKNSILVDNPPNFYISHKGKIRYIIVNGFYYDLKTETNFILNGIKLQ